jgi:hypothetical protein
MKIDRSKFLLLCASMVPVVAIACGGSGDDGTAGGGSAISDAPAAAGGSEAGAPAPAADAVTVNTKAINTKTNNCTLDLKVPTVSIPTNKAAETAINKALEPLATSPCDEGAGGDVESTFEVTANAGGLLSIRVSGDSFFQGAAHPNGSVQTFNFDVKNGGKQLKLSDVLTAAGSAKELAQCIKTLDAANSDDGTTVDEAGVGAPTNEGSESADDCKLSLTSDADPQFPTDPSWVATKDGLEIEAGVSHAAGDFMSSTVAWKDLGTDGLTPNTVVAGFAKAQK